MYIGISGSGGFDLVCQSSKSIDQVTTVFPQSSFCKNTADFQLFHLKERELISC